MPSLAGPGEDGAKKNAEGSGRGGEVISKTTRATLQNVRASTMPASFCAHQKAPTKARWGRNGHGRISPSKRVGLRSVLRSAGPRRRPRYGRGNAARARCFVNNIASFFGASVLISFFFWFFFVLYSVY